MLLTEGWNVGGDAATHYANGVSASILQWGGDQAAADAYLLESDVAWDASMANQRIGTQKWIAMFDQGIEAWCTWKMYDHPTMNTAAAAGTTPPTRYNYSVDEPRQMVQMFLQLMAELLMMYLTKFFGM